jgi:hypothetical protein
MSENAALVAGGASKFLWRDNRVKRGQFPGLELGQALRRFEEALGFGARQHVFG